MAYAAGFFDGEGHVRIQRHSARGTYMLQVQISQATLEPLDWFQALFGGTVKRRLIPYRGGERVLHSWQASSATAEAFLRAIRPYARNKADEIDLALEFRGTMLPAKRACVGERLPEGLAERRAAMAERLKMLRHSKRADA